MREENHSAVDYSLGGVIRSLGDAIVHMFYYLLKVFKKKRWKSTADWIHFCDINHSL